MVIVVVVACLSKLLWLMTVVTLGGASAMQRLLSRRRRNKDSCKTKNVISAGTVSRRTEITLAVRRPSLLSYVYPI